MAPEGVYRRRPTGTDDDRSQGGNKMMNLNKLMEMTTRYTDNGADRIEKSSQYTIGKYCINEQIITDNDGEELYRAYEIHGNDNEFKPEELEYLPSIYYNFLPFGTPSCFEITTTSYGTLKVEEIEKVVDGYKEAVEVVKVLTKAFC